MSYRGGGQYRNDYSIFTNYRYRYDEDNQFTVGAELQRRRYPDGPLRERSRTTATASAGWVRSLFDGRGSFSLTGHGGYNYATSRPDGDSAIFGATEPTLTTHSPTAWPVSCSPGGSATSSTRTRSTSIPIRSIRASC